MSNKEGGKNWGKRLMLAGLIVPALLALALLFLQHAESKRVAEQKYSLLRAAADLPYQVYESSMLADLPAPVARYFRYALTDGQPLIGAVDLSQSGILRTSVSSPDWTAFTAKQRVVPVAPGFVWNARVAVRPGFYVSVLDSYNMGVGVGRVSLYGAISVVQAENIAELNSGALYRYLAEAPWYPTALLPQAGVQWTAVDDNTAIASLADNGNTASVEFRFNETGQITGMYTEGRFGQFDGGYRKTPWQGEFRNYELVDGMQVPHYGEVGWVVDGQLELVWKGEVENFRYGFLTSDDAGSSQ